VRADRDTSRAEIGGASSERRKGDGSAGPPSISRRAGRCGSGSWSRPVSRTVRPRGV